MKYMRVVKYIIMVGVLVLGQVATAATAVFGSASETRYARHLTPPKGKALIYIYQGEHGGVSPEIWLNNYEIGRIVPGSFTVWELAPGQLELRVDGPQPAKLSLISQAGKVYLFRLNVMGNSAEIENLPQSYRNELATLRLIKNPRDVTAEVTPPPAVKTTTPEVTTTASAQPKTRPQRHVSAAEYIRPGGISLMLKSGSFSLATQNQTILGYQRTFKKSASGLYDIELDSQYADGEAVGGELMSYKADYTTVSPPGQGEATVTTVLANAKMYFRTHSHFQPYMGVGIGLAVTDVSGDINGKTAGFAYQVLAGAEYRSATVGVFAEAKYLGAKTKDSNGQNLDVSGSGILAGVAFHF